MEGQAGKQPVILTLASGVAVVAMGITALRTLPAPQSFAFLQGSLTLGGGFLIAGLFSFKSYWHGLMGAGVLALLGTAWGLMNLPDLAMWLAGDRSHAGAPILEAGVTAISAWLLWRTLTVLKRERQRRNETNDG